MVRADQIDMQNGDRYCGTVVSMTPEAVVLQSEILGQVKVPRAKVSNISFGAGNPLPHPAAATNNATLEPAKASTDTDAALRQLGASTNLIEGIRKQFLSDAGPAANEKFDELMTGLMTGKLDMNALRAQAQSAADQLRAMKKDMGGDAGETLDTYLAVLDHFLGQSDPVTPTPAPATNSAQGTIIIR